MAITAPRTLADFEGFLTPEESAPIFDEAARESVVQRLTRRVPLGIAGQKIPVTTGKPVANWVGEGGQKPATQGTKALRHIEPKKLTAIVVNSAEVVRADPGGYVSGLRSDLAEAFAIAFDYAALHNLGGDGTGTGPFDNFVAQTTKAVVVGTGATVHNDIVAGLELLVNDGRRLSGFAFDDVAEPVFLNAVDQNNRPIYIDTPLDDTTRARGGRLIGRPSFMGEGISHTTVVPGTPTITTVKLGFGGNWTKAAWGAVGGINFRVSTESTVTIGGQLTSLFEDNLVAILAEAEYGWVMDDPEHFVAYQTETSS